MKRIIGIDLGTTNTCAAFVQHGVPRVIPTQKGYNTLPSVVHYAQDGRVILGQTAKEQAVLHPKTTLQQTKRLIGRRFDSNAVQAVRRFFTFDLAETPDGGVGAKVGDKLVTPVDVAATILREMARYAAQHLGEPVSDVVICVPAYFSDVQRQAVKDAAQAAGLHLVRLVNEPTAASLAYGFNRSLQQKILVYDLGGGTFDVSILELDGNVFEVVATGGDNFLGGADFDNRIMAYVLEAFLQKEGIDLSQDVVLLQRLRGAAELAKCELSLLANTDIHLPFVAERRGKPVDLSLTLSRDVLNQLSADLVQRTIDVSLDVLGQRGLSVEDLGEVILVGGMTRMPAVQAAIQQAFKKAPRKGVHPDEVVALGAALLGDSLDQIDSVTLIDVLSVPIGIGIGAGKLLSIFGRNQSLPATQTMTMPTVTDDQTRMEIDFYQGDTDQVAGADYLGTLVFDGIPSRKAGEVKVKVDIELDAEGLVKIAAADTVRNVRQQLTLQAAGKPTRAPGQVSERVSPGAEVRDPADGTLRALVRNILGSRK